MTKEGIINFSEKEYPAKLKNIDTPPPFLRWKGNLNKEILGETLAVVGSRRASSYGKMIAENLVKDIAGEGITIVSGFMYGIDAIAHKSALEVGGKTIAVMPCGIDIVHPAYQASLYNQIAQKGLIFSELKDGFKPERWTYVKRNRIVVGLSSAILVIEAEEKSGSLISANFAKKYKRKIFAVPGPINSSTSKGTNNLIKEGASIVTSANDILSFFKRDKKKVFEDKKKNLDPDEKKVVAFLEIEMADIDTISKNTEIDISKLNKIISLLELKGFIKKRENRYHLSM